MNTDRKRIEDLEFKVFEKEAIIRNLQEKLSQSDGRGRWNQSPYSAKTKVSSSKKSPKYQPLSSVKKKRSKRNNESILSGTSVVSMKSRRSRSRRNFEKRR